jgi:hypothetical protein
MSDFTQVGVANFRACISGTRMSDTAAKKQDIIDTLESFHNVSPVSVLFMGFSTFIFAQYNANLYATDLTDEMQDYLKSEGVQYTYIPRDQLSNYAKKFQVVIAVDEFFTYADSDQSQRDLVAEISNLVTDYVITTLRDYKNQDYRDREFSQPTVLRNDDNHMIFLEAHEADQTDRNAWSSTIYQIVNPDNKLTTYGEFQRRAMYFKQLAKFSFDAGATNFLVHKNLMYKSLIKKNYEHVISIKFN